MWLVDRLTGSVYRCQATDRGEAACEPDIVTGSISDARRGIEARPLSGPAL